MSTSDFDLQNVIKQLNQKNQLSSPNDWYLGQLISGTQLVNRTQLLLVNVTLTTGLYLKPGFRTLLPFKVLWYSTITLQKKNKGANSPEQ